MKIFHGSERILKRATPLLIYCLVWSVAGMALLLWRGTPTVSAQGMNGSVDYTWEKRSKEGKDTTQFTQVYDLILKRGLPHLYDASAKLEFRSETIGGEEKRRTQLLPALNMNFGNQIMNYGAGWSRDSIEYEKGSYTNERFYSTFRLNPQKFPRILCQYWTENRDRGIERETSENEHNLAFMEDYSVNLGHLNLTHSYSTKRRDLNEDISSIYDLSNRARIGHRFVLFNNQWDIGTRYEISHDKNKQDDGRKNTIVGHNANVDFTNRPYSWMNTNYNFLFGLVDQKNPGNRETTFGHNLAFLLLPNPFFSTEIGGSHTRYTETLESNAREKAIYSLKLIPDLRGLFIDPNKYFVYPLRSYLLISRFSEKGTGDVRERGVSFLLNSSTTLYRGVDIIGEVGSSIKKNYISSGKDKETWLDIALNLKLMPGLSGVVKEKNKWTQNAGGGNDWTNFDGSLETKLMYRPIETLLVSLGGTLEYGGEKSSYEYSLGWKPLNRKTEINVHYVSGDEEKKEYFLGQFNYNVSRAIQFRFQYQDPSVEQKVFIKCTIDF